MDNQNIPPAAPHSDELSSLRRRVAELKALDANREQALEALRVSEERYRTLVETTNTGYCILDLEGAGVQRQRGVHPLVSSKSHIRWRHCGRSSARLLRKVGRAETPANLPNPAISGLA